MYLYFLAYTILASTFFVWHSGVSNDSNALSTLVANTWVQFACELCRMSIYTTGDRVGNLQGIGGGVGTREGKKT